MTKRVFIHDSFFITFPMTVKREGCKSYGNSSSGINTTRLPCRISMSVETNEKDRKIIETSIRDQELVPPNKANNYYARHFVVHQTGKNQTGKGRGGNETER